MCRQLLLRLERVTPLGCGELRKDPSSEIGQCEKGRLSHRQHRSRALSNAKYCYLAYCTRYHSLSCDKKVGVNEGACPCYPFLDDILNSLSRKHSKSYHDRIRIDLH